MRSGISRGTETLVFRGGVPADQHARMRAPFQEGDFPAPVKYGYLNVGAGMAATCRTSATGSGPSSGSAVPGRSSR